MVRDGPDSGVRLAELVAAFSLATDLGLGQPMEHVLRSGLISARLADQLGLDDDARASLYYVSMLAWVGCVADTPELASWFGDDIAYRKDSYTVDLAGLPMLGFLLRHVGAGSPALRRVRVGASLMVNGGKAVERTIMSHCLNTGRLAGCLGLGAEVCDPLQQVFTRWDGKGVPAGVGGAEIALTVRLFHLADIVEVFHREGGVGAAVDVVRGRRGGQFDPEVADAFCDAAGDVLAGVDPSLDWEALIESEPGLDRRLSDEELDSALEAVADFTDLRSSWRVGHSRGVADLAASAGELYGLPPDEVMVLRRAALVHDIGMHGLPATILDKPGPLIATETERMRLHAYYTERTLARPAPLARIGGLASMTNERLDGSGYHRRLPGAAIPAPARILAAADAFRAMSEDRAHRPARTPALATAELRSEVRAGALAADAVDAVLAAAGQRPGKRRVGVAGLTPRELEVLVLIARGASTRQVAQRLAIRPKTAETHIERIYAKTGSSTRATVSLFAMQHGLLDSFEPFDS
jgi:HD-GYP domain-containing protein (c-di-GMP phosphodiesterase class II)